MTLTLCADYPVVRLMNIRVPKTCAVSLIFTITSKPDGLRNIEILYEFHVLHL